MAKEFSVRVRREIKQGLRDPNTGELLNKGNAGTEDTHIEEEEEEEEETPTPPAPPKPAADNPNRHKSKEAVNVTIDTDLMNDVRAEMKARSISKSAAISIRLAANRYIKE